MDSVNFGTAEIIAVVAVVIAVAVVIVPWWYQLLLEQAAKSLERAYEALTDRGQSTSPPVAGSIG